MAHCDESCAYMFRIYVKCTSIYLINASFLKICTQEKKLIYEIQTAKIRTSQFSLFNHMLIFGIGINNTYLYTNL